MPPESFPQRLNGKLYRLFVALLFVYAALTCFGPMMNQVDLGWQVAQGRWIVHHFTPYSHDLFNYPNLGRPVINEYPLFEIVLYLAWSLGWWGPCLLAAAAYVTLIVVIIRGARAVGTPESAFVAVALGLMFLYFQFAFPLRPHLATYLGVIIAGTFLLVHRDADNWTSFWPIALLQIAWTNCHSGFVLGPAMVGLFGAEVTLRRWLRAKAFPALTARTWLGATALVFLACLINPSGWARFYPPFFQDRLESIRAYVGEMEPLTGGAATLAFDLTALSAIVIALNMILNRGAISFAFLLLAALLFGQAREIMKAWPVVGLFVPLLVLSSAAFAPRLPRPVALPGVLALFLATSSAALALIGRLNPAWDSSLVQQWHEVDRGHTELPTEAVAWMKANRINGRIFDRCEFGGLLQQEGFTDGQTFADTGFGKYDEAFIHEVGLVNERPALIPKFLDKYHPDFIVCGNFCYQWPYYLRTSGWRLIFYSPNSSVWTQDNAHSNLPSSDEIKWLYAVDTRIGQPAASLLGRNIISLNSLGYDDFAWAQLTGQPVAAHHASWYWEAARIMCFETPALSAKHRDDLMREAESLHDGSLTAEYRAYAKNGAGDIDGAFAILKAIPAGGLSNASAELLLKIELERNLPEALPLGRRTDCFDLRNGRHWQYLAQAEERWGSLKAARSAWKKAVFYYPDDEVLMQAAKDFAAKQKDTELSREISVPL